MKAIVLAGGHATRLWPLTRDRAKPLLPLGGQPIIQYSTDALAAMDVVDEILISTNARYADDFRDFIAAQGYTDVRVVVEEHLREEDKLGSLGAIIQVIEQEGVDDYLVVGGDNYPSFDLADFATTARERDAVTIACHQVATTEEATAFGVIDTGADQRITDFTEKPEQPASRLVSTAYYYFPASALTLLDRYQEVHAGTEDYLDEPGRLLEWGHAETDMYAYPFEGEWHDIGTPKNYLRAQAAVAGERQVAGEVSDSTLGDRVWVMEGANVEGSDIEDCIIFPGANIVDSSLEGCIVDEEATVVGKTLQDSVIGAYSTVR